MTFLMLFKAFLGFWKMLKAFENTLLVPRGCFQTFRAHWSWFQILLSFQKPSQMTLPTFPKAFSRHLENIWKFENTLCVPSGCLSTSWGHWSWLQFLLFLSIFVEMTLPMLPRVFSGLLLSIGVQFFFVNGYLVNNFQSKAEYLRYFPNVKTSSWTT